MTTPKRTYRFLVENVAPEAPKVPTAQPDSWTLLSRGYCHLCDELLAAARAYGIDPAVIDVDQDANLTEKWDEKIPVLLLNGRMICFHRFDISAITQSLS